MTTFSNSVNQPNPVRSSVITLTTFDDTTTHKNPSTVRLEAHALTLCRFLHSGNPWKKTGRPGSPDRVQPPPGRHTPRFHSIRQDRGTPRGRTGESTFARGVHFQSRCPAQADDIAREPACLFDVQAACRGHSEPPAPNSAVRSLSIPARRESHTWPPGPGEWGLIRFYCTSAHRRREQT